MKKRVVFLLLSCFLTTVSFAQTEERELTEAEKAELKKAMEELEKDMDQLQVDLKQTFKDLKMEMEDIDIDLSGLDELKNMDWDKIDMDEADRAYLNSAEFREKMKNVQKEVDRAMVQVRKEMAELQKINFEEISRAIEKAMKEVETELSEGKRKRQ